MLGDLEVFDGHKSAASFAVHLTLVNAVAGTFADAEDRSRWEQVGGIVTIQVRIFEYKLPDVGDIEA